MSATIGRMEPTAPDDRPPPPVVFRLWERRSAYRPFAAASAVSVVAGGALAAAIAAPAPTRHGVWAAAYLVLVLGVGQLVLGVGQALLASTPPTARMAIGVAAFFNAANIAILLGIVTDHIFVFDAGSVLLLVTLTLFLHGVRSGARAGWPLSGYRLFVSMLIVSIPIGLLITTTSGS